MKLIRKFANVPIFLVCLVLIASLAYAATYKTNQAQSKNLYHVRDADSAVVVSKYTLVSNMVTNDIFQMVAVPPGSVVTDVALVTETIGNVTVLSVGYTGNTAYFIGNTTIGQTGGRVVTNGMAAGPLYLANGGTIDVKAVAGPGTGALCNMWLTVTYGGLNSN